ncbi:hypothetical protein BGX38DRAFT_1197888 [Terfezia claveryi]|nr:hypothetical protein BGX38DRAFT_1197888 [Terfezia claveryi]
MGRWKGVLLKLKPLDESEDRPGMWDEGPTPKESDSDNKGRDSTATISRQERCAAEKAHKETAIAPGREDS